VSNSLAPISVTNVGDLLDRLRGLGPAERPAILLSASVPYIRETTPDMTPEEREQLRELSTRYVQSAQPQRIRLAVMELTKAALMRHAQLIFGAHPAISPMVLEAARNVGVEPDSILIFQSDFFANRIPRSTLALADWSAGRLFLTPQRPARRQYNARKESLGKMRSLMVSPPNLRGAIFVGGMEGVEEEAKLFKSAHPNLPCYAIASTGSAALDLFDRTPRRTPSGAPHGFAGSLPDPDILKTGTSYSLLARKILDDMGIPAPLRSRRAR
jgi:SLOG cluster3 family